MAGCRSCPAPSCPINRRNANMKIGVFATFMSPLATPQMIRDFGRRAEGMGLESIWMGEHVALFDKNTFGYPGSKDGRIPVPEGGGMLDVTAAFRRAVRFGAGWYGFNLDPARAKAMLDRLDAAFAKAGRKRDAAFEIIITPPLAMAADDAKKYAELGIHRLVVNLGSQRPEKV